uniref:Uncharacterized protein n=1 Tax=Auxenochlorella protothecoides TaxID=3075 RepID=A0A1D2A375_AUXPR
MLSMDTSPGLGVCGVGVMAAPFHPCPCVCMGLALDRAPHAIPSHLPHSSLAPIVHVLCLDELFVTDVADASILNRLFQRLWRVGQKHGWLECAWAHLHRSSQAGSQGWRGIPSERPGTDSDLQPPPRRPVRGRAPARPLPPLHRGAQGALPGARHGVHDRLPHAGHAQRGPLLSDPEPRRRSVPPLRRAGGRAAGPPRVRPGGHGPRAGADGGRRAPGPRALRGPVRPPAGRGRLHCPGAGQAHAAPARRARLHGRQPLAGLSLRHAHRRAVRAPHAPPLLRGGHPLGPLCQRGHRGGGRGGQAQGPPARPGAGGGRQPGVCQRPHHLSPAGDAERGVPGGACQVPCPPPPAGHPGAAAQGGGPRGGAGAGGGRFGIEGAEEGGGGGRHPGYGLATPPPAPP